MIITTSEDAMSKIRFLLPQSLQGVLMKLDSQTREKITEIRLREGRASTVTIDGENCCLTDACLTKNMSGSINITSEELDAFIYRLCKGSVYSYESTLREGYITSDGIRVGISGKVNVKNGDVEGFGKIRGVNIRLPHHIPGCSRDVLDYLSQNGFPDGRGILISSNPGVGKTTLLRDLAKNLSEGFMLSGEKKTLRVCVIDERNEIYMDNVFSHCAVDFLSDCPKSKGLEIASRVLSPQVMICDEIGSEKEADEILKGTSGGIIFIASVHADCLEAIFSKPHIKKLIDGGVFGGVYCMKRTRDKVCGVFSELGKRENA